MRYVAVIAGFFAFLAVTQPAAARDHRERDEGWGGGREHEMQRPDMHRPDMHGPDMHGREWRGGRPPLDRFLPDIRRRQPGRLLDVEPGWGARGEPRNRIKWLTPDGRVLWLEQDARTGEILGVEGAPPPPYNPWRR